MIHFYIATKAKFSLHPIFKEYEKLRSLLDFKGMTVLKLNAIPEAVHCRRFILHPQSRTR